MTATAPNLEDFMFTLTLETHVRAPLETTFAVLLEQVGPYNETHEGKPLRMKIEPWPGGRWYRDLGDGNGHFWAVVQAIKRPTLLEFAGPLFASDPLVSNVQYRLEEANGGTLIKFRHSALGFMRQEYKTGVSQGWTALLGRVRAQAEGGGTPGLH